MKPTDAFADFFDRHEMKEVHSQIDLLIKIALTTDCCEFDKYGQRAELFYLRDNLLKCLDAVFILAKKQREKFFQEAEKKRQYLVELVATLIKNDLYFYIREKIPQNIKDFLSYGNDMERHKRNILFIEVGGHK